MFIEGKIIKGKGIASGKNIDTNDLTNTIGYQLPFFAAAGVPVDNIRPGTINVGISPHEFRIIRPDHTVTCTWWPGSEKTPPFPETFRLVEAQVIFESNTYPGLIYYPMPSAYKSHPDTKIELLAEDIPGIKNEKPIGIQVEDGKLEVYRRD
jgi:hypothetical protein